MFSNFLDDLWVISERLDFDAANTVLAKSVFFGPNSNNEVEIERVAGVSFHSWKNEGAKNIKETKTCHVDVFYSRAHMSYSTHSRLQPPAMPCILATVVAS